MINSTKTDNYSDKMQKCMDYLESLEEERRKIQVFQRELPLCLELVSQAIEKCKKEFHSPKQLSECTEQTSSEGPVLEEFMPMKRAASSEEDELHSKKAKSIIANNNRSENSSKKSDWLRSVQLWNQTPDPPTTKEGSSRKVTVVEVNKNGNGGAFHPFKREDKRKRNVEEAPLAASASSTEETGGSSGGCKGENKEDPHRKARRSWSPELHRRFLQALQQLGGSHVGTPKQIRELMKVDGLTNDEIKSHLQKYRLHTSPRPSPSSNNTQAPQFVVVGGIWMSPPPEYTSTTVTSGEAGLIRSSPPNGIYAQQATLPMAYTEEATNIHRQQSETNYSPKNGCHSDSPGTSLSSAHTNIASPAY